MDAMRENALAAALAEARASLSALQRQHEAGQRALADLQVGPPDPCVTMGIDPSLTLSWGIGVQKAPG